MLLLDAGVWIASKDPDERYSEVARSLVLDPERAVTALDLTLYEVGNVIGARRRRPGAAMELLRTIGARCGDRVVRVDAELLAAALEVASEHGLTVYDAAYVAAARRDGWTLVSTDIADLVSKGLAVAPEAADYP
jgi:predicted nucleic acid-binding protein